MGQPFLHPVLTSPGSHTGLPTKAFTALPGPWALNVYHTLVRGIPQGAPDQNPGASATLEWKSGSVLSYN